MLLNHYGLECRMHDEVRDRRSAAWRAAGAGATWRAPHAGARRVIRLGRLILAWER